MRSLLILFYCLQFGLISAKEVCKLDTVPHTQNIGLVSTELSDRLLADVAENIPLIQPPDPISSGAATVDFRFNLPEGRQNMQAPLVLSYNSEQGETWLGTGWDISLSSISLDTRWGVPRFDPDIESEIYLLDGAQLGPVFHRDLEYPREEDRIFQKRQTKDFMRIQRMGSSPGNYWWHVTDKEGKQMYYGYDPATGVVETALLRDKDGHIVDWKLTKEIDRFGNTVDYEYAKFSFAKGKYVYPRNIYYTGFQNEKGLYRVSFVMQSELGEETRNDIDIDYRTGARIVLADLLKKCEVYFQDSLIRYYTFDYVEGFFNKTLLSGISEYAGDDSSFYSYEFEYHNLIETAGMVSAYAAPVEWNVPGDDVVNDIIPIDLDAIKAKPTILGGSNAKSSGKGIAITLGPPFNPASKINSAGPNFSSTSTKGNGAISLLDINSDGLPDKVFKEGDKLYYRPNLAINNSLGGSFGDKVDILNMKDFSVSETSAFSVGFEVNLAGFYGGISYDNSNTTISTYFSDFNGDELVDIAHNGTVYFNTVNDAGQIEFTKDSDMTESPIIKGVPLDDDIVSLTPEEIEALQAQFPLHDVVRRWEAPFDGRIRIEGTVKLIEDTSPEAQNYAFADGVIVSIQRDNDELWDLRIDADDFSAKTPSNVDDIRVQAGDHIYFRVVSVDDGLYDEVQWDPVILYYEEDLDEKDVNEKSVYRFSCSEDFLINSNERLSIPKDGLVSLRSVINKDVTSDDVRIFIPGYLDLRLDHDTVLDTIILLDSIQVLAEQKFSFELRTDSEIDYKEISWNIDMEYISFADGSDVLDSNGETVLVLCPGIKYNIYRSRDERAEKYEPESSERFTATLDLDFNAFDGEGYLVAKSDRRLLSKRRFTEGDAGSSIEISGDMVAGEQIEFAVFCKSYNDLPNSFLNEQVSLESSNDNSNVRPAFYTGLSDEERQYGTMYRNWGQFIYNGNETPSPDVIDEADLELNVMESDTIISDDTEGGSDAGSESFIVMTSDPKRLAWQGSDDLTFVTADRMSSSRFGRKNVNQLSVPSAGENDIPAINLMSMSEAISLAGGYEVGGGGTSWATTKSILDISDMNGDRYPDVISATSIQYSDIRGGLSDQIFSHSMGAHTASSFAFGGGLGGSRPASFAQNAGAQAGGGGNRRSGRMKSKLSKAATKAKGAFNAARAGVGFSGNVNSDRDSLQHSWLDINGDGLEDKVWINGDVALNRGYDFDSKENWGFSQIRHGQSLDVTFGLGISLFNGSIVAGKSYSRSTNFSNLAFMDLNDDALVDIIESVDPLVVRWNTGNGFTEPMTWYDRESFDYGVSIGEAENYAVTGCIELFFFRICINPSTFSGNSNSSITTAILDIDGDGFPDYLEAEKQDDNLIVRRSKIGSTNLLKSIHNPLGGRIDISYKVAGNSYSLPFSKWVIESVRVDDGVSGDGSDVSLTTFDFSEGRYDRHERQFLGFGKVEEHHWQGEALFRSLVIEFYNDNIYEQGLIRSSSIQNSDGHVFNRTENRYVLIDINSGSEVSGATKDRDDLMVFPALQSEVISYSEISGEVLLTRREYLYDLYGNVEEQRHVFPDATEDNYTERFDYYNDDSRYLKSFVLKSTISQGSDTIRETNYTYDSLANMVRLSRQITKGEYADYDYVYDIYGNEIESINPPNHAGDRFYIKNEYDDVVWSYVLKEEDAYGYVKTFDYDYAHGNLTRSVDINGHPTHYRHDKFGRPISIQYPFGFYAERESDVLFNYFLESDVAYSLCEQYDVVHDEYLKNYAFSDGLGRDIQTQTQAFIVDGPTGNPRAAFIVSGTTSYDSLGRVVASYHPISILSVSAGRYQADSDGVDPLVMEYDVLDRPVFIIERDGGVHSYRYDIENNTKSIKLMLAEKTDALGQVSKEYFDLRGNLKSEHFLNSEGDVVRYFNYDIMSDLLSIEDSEGNYTYYQYDKLGRRISVAYPGTGLTELKYDAAGNLTDRVTATIRDVISTDGSIRYSYDKERLIQIDYPKYFQNKVQIHYGMPSDSFNRRGRVWLIEDASGGREYFFDYNGNAIKEIRTIMVERNTIPSFVTEWEYDMWGRVQKMIYPDGEALTYGYNEAGQLTSLFGEKGGYSYSYISDIVYDKFDDINRIDYGNGLSDLFYFEDEKGRLYQRQLNGNSGRNYEESYRYDLQDNIIGSSSIQMADDESLITESETVFDPLYRMEQYKAQLEGDAGIESLDMTVEHSVLNLPSFKSQELLVNSEIDYNFTRVLDYQYGESEMPYRPSEIGGRGVQYDLNGNILLINSDRVFNFSQQLFDEENRMMAQSNNGYISRYTYDAFGERAIKSHGASQGVFVNGAPAGYVEHEGNVTVYVNPYFSWDNELYIKHYYLGEHRVLSKESTGNYNSLITKGSEISAGGIDYKSRIQQYELSVLDYYAELAIPPGPPTLLAYGAQPEINTISLPDATNASSYDRPGPQWPALIPEPDSLGAPGPPVFYQDIQLTNADVKAGYGFSDTGIVFESKQYYYHYDILNNTRMVSDLNGKVSHSYLFMPTGELWKSIQSNVLSPAYLYNWNELDEESGLYYFGDEYYDPVFDISMSVDAVEQNFGERTYKKQLDGMMFYEYAHDDIEPDFDTEILNSEKPEPLIAGSPGLPDMGKIKYQNYDHLKDAFRDETPLFTFDDTEIKRERRNITFKPIDDEKTVEHRIEFAELNEINQNLEFFNGTKLDFTKAKSIQRLRYEKMKANVKSKFRKLKNKIKAKIRIR